MKTYNKHMWHMWFAWYPVWALYFDGKAIKAKRCWLGRIQRRRSDQVWEYKLG